MHLASLWPSCLQTCYGTNSPIWSDAFTFFIQDPRKQDIDIQVGLMSCFQNFISCIFDLSVTFVFNR